MTRIVSTDDMANVRHSLAQAGIYFDKLYINQVRTYLFLIRSIISFNLFRLISIVILLYKHQKKSTRHLKLTIFGINYYVDQVSFHIII